MAVSILEVLGEEVTGIGPHTVCTACWLLQGDKQAVTTVCRPLCLQRCRFPSASR